MKITILRRLLSALLCLTLLVGALGLTACSEKSPALLELDGHTITAAQYQFFLSRVKGSLYYTGYNVDSADFWNMIIDDQNNTYDDYFRNAVLEDAPGVDFFGTPDKEGRYWLDKLCGTDAVRKMIVAGESAEAIKASWQADIDAFKKQRRPYLLYEE